MSANFPWGFDLPELGRSDAEVLTIDGGVLDNTGIDTYKILLDRLELIADPNTLAKYPAELQRRAKDLLAELARRGIVIRRQFPAWVPASIPASGTQLSRIVCSGTPSMCSTT